MKNNFFYFFGTAKFSEMILIYLLNKKMSPKIVVSTPKNFKIF